MSVQDYCKRNKFIREFGLNSYKEVLESKNWKDLNLWIKENSPSYNHCFICGNNPYCLHHLKYTKKFLNLIRKPTVFDTETGKPFKKLIKWLIPVCRHCHYGIHQLERDTGLGINKATERYIKENCGKKRIFYWRFK